jgi:hypothetical protein
MLLWRGSAGDPAAAAAEIMEKQLVSKIGNAHAMADVECPVCLDTPCEVVQLFACTHDSVRDAYVRCC